MPTPSNTGKESREAQPYGSFTMAIKYLRYYLGAINGKGHGVHSPFVFDFIQQVLNRSAVSKKIQDIENLRLSLLKDDTIIEVDDYGAGSTMSNKRKRAVNSIASSSLKSPKYGRLLHNMVGYYKPVHVIELGTSLGITTAYLACADSNSKVISIEGASEVSAIAQKNIDQLAISNVSLLEGRFEDKLQEVLSDLGDIDFAFIDGNHRLQPTLEYFRQLVSYAAPLSLLVFDDIHWSAEMEAAWKEIKNNQAVSMTIDLFFLGIVLIHPDIKIKQHFTIRF